VRRLRLSGRVVTATRARDVAANHDDLQTDEDNRGERSVV
jgi:hypothetical protein